VYVRIAECVGGLFSRKTGFEMQLMNRSGRGFVLVSESGARYPRRSRIGIMVCILGNSGPDSGMARLAQTCNLTPSQFSLYTDFLVKLGLLEVSMTEDGVEVLGATAKGEKFLREYKEIEGLNGP